MPANLYVTFQQTEIPSYTQETTAPSRSEEPELGPHTTPASQTSVPGPTNTRPRRAVREPAYLKDYVRN